MKKNKNRRNRALKSKDPWYWKHANEFARLPGPDEGVKKSWINHGVLTGEDGTQIAIDKIVSIRTLSASVGINFVEITDRKHVIQIRSGHYNVETKKFGGKAVQLEYFYENLLRQINHEVKYYEGSTSYVMFGGTLFAILGIITVFLISDVFPSMWEKELWMERVVFL